MGGALALHPVRFGPALRGHNAPTLLLINVTARLDESDRGSNSRCVQIIDQTATASASSEPDRARSPPHFAHRVALLA